MPTLKTICRESNKPVSSVPATFLDDSTGGSLRRLDTQEEPFAALLATDENDGEDGFGYLTAGRSWDDAWPVFDMVI